MADAIAASPNHVSSRDARASNVSGRQLSLLAYVHLRNIYRSTGAGRVARQLVEHLARRQDINLRILADSSDHARLIPVVGEPWAGFRYHLFASDTSRQQANWFLFDRPRAEAYWPDAQIVFCTAESYVPVSKARLVVTLHDAAYFEADAHARDGAFSRQRFKWKLLYRKLARKADLFHTVSQFSAERLGHFFPEIRSRLRVVHNAVTPHFFADMTPEGSQQFEALGLCGRPFILLPGGLHFRKNAELVFKAWPLLRELHPEVILAVVNHSNPHHVEKSKRFGDGFRILGFVSDECLRVLYARAEAVWFPSRYEGFGLPVVEAMACGAPVIAAHSSSLPEIAAGAALLASPDAPKSHVELLHTVLCDSEIRRDLSRKGMRRASAFTWESSAAQLKGHFETLI